MMQILLVAAGGAIGSVLRYLIGLRFNPAMVGNEMAVGFPVSTLMVNVAGCLVIGVGYVLLQQVDQQQTFNQLRGLLIVGVLGGFTTFSTFSLETLHLINAGLWQKALLNIIASLVLCLVGTALGLWLGRAISA